MHFCFLLFLLNKYYLLLYTVLFVKNINLWIFLCHMSHIYKLNGLNGGFSKWSVPELQKLGGSVFWCFGAYKILHFILPSPSSQKFYFFPLSQSKNRRVQNIRWQTICLKDCLHLLPSLNHSHNFQFFLFLPTRNPLLQFPPHLNPFSKVPSNDLTLLNPTTPKLQHLKRV